MLAGDFYTLMPANEIRRYFQGGYKGGVIDGFVGTDMAEKILIPTHAIEYVYEVQVPST